MRRIIRPEDGQRVWDDTLAAHVAGWQQVTPAGLAGGDIQADSDGPGGRPP